MANIAKYAKFLMALLTAVVSTITVQFPSTSHWLTAVVSVVGAVLVLLVPNSAVKFGNRTPEK